MAQTIAQKILAIKSKRKEVRSGEFVEAEPDLAMSHDNAALVIRQFRQIGVEKVWDAEKIVILLDHRAPAESIKTANAHKSIREFVREQSIQKFYDVGEGICHQVIVEKGHILPGQLAVGTDSHTTSYGCLSAFATGIGATEMAAVWATGRLWFCVPETIKVTISGGFPAGVYAKDLILFIVGKLTAEGANYKSVEFYGQTVRKMSVSERFTLANLSMEMGAKSAIVPFDQVTEKYLAGITDHRYQPVYADEGSVYEEKYEFDVSHLRPQVACPHKVDNVKPIDELLGVKIQQAVLGSCTNGRLDDLEVAAKILQGKRIHSDVRMLIFPGSRDIYLEALKRGYIKIFLEAGGLVMNPGCGPCLGAHEGILADGERCIATTNRNFRGRMGSGEAEVYLASPATVAASALKGEIASAAYLDLIVG